MPYVSLAGANGSLYPLPPNIFPIFRAVSYGIVILPISIYFPDETRTQYIDITKEEFFHKITVENLEPTTGVPSPRVYKETFDKALEKAEEAIMINLSSELSGIHGYGLIYAKQFAEKEHPGWEVNNITYELKDQHSYDVQQISKNEFDQVFEKCKVNVETDKHVSSMREMEQNLEISGSQLLQILKTLL